MMRLAARALGACLPFTLSLISPARAQEPSKQESGAPGAQDPRDALIRFRLPTVTVTAQKESEDVQELPASVTAVTKETLDRAGVFSVSDAAQYAPNTFFQEFTARKLSNPRFRGVGSSPNNPGITTYIDGVPQFNANSSSIELIDIDQIEFVRGPQSALFGRNTLGGLVNITSVRPSLERWNGRLTGPYGNFSSGAVQGSVSGPLIADKLALGVGIGYSGREGFSTNDVTGHDLDSRSAVFGKVQALWVPAPSWEVRGIVGTERARDGDYGLADLESLRAKPFHASRDFEGFTHRDLVTPTVLVNRIGKTIDFSSTTGFVWWKTDDLTDLDYTALPLITRANDEKDLQFTQEFRVASAKNAALLLSDHVTLKWQAGLFLFTQDYSQDAVNTYSPYLLSAFIPFSVGQHSPQSELDDHGVGVFGRGTLTFNRRLDVTVGVRTDYEDKSATLNTFYSPAIAPALTVDAKKDFSDVSPQFTVAFRAVPRNMVYFTAARGFKAGGFNAASIPGSEAYGEEHSWNYEGGAKSSWFDQRLAVNAAVFYINWRDLQVNVPNPFVPAQFYIANAGEATSKGFELEVNARPLARVDLFAGVGYAKARFGSASVSAGIDVSGNRIANTPNDTANAGVEYSHPLSSGATIRARAEFVRYGDFVYDDANTAGQPAYALANFRAGVHGTRLFAEAWVRNAFDSAYVLTAFAYPGLAPSGFIGENGPARTFGIRAGVTF